jgi:formylmethanofuran dehydrogenase subunit E
MMVIKLNEELKNIEQFHGHIGPYAVIGFRMGKISNEILGKNPFSKKAQVFTDARPPMSCVIDGIQMSSGCTLGKGNLAIFSGKLPKVLFSNNDGKQVEIVLKKSIKNEIDTIVTEKNIITYSEKLYQKPDKELFEIR